MTREESIKICTREKECVQSALDACAAGGHYVSPDGIITAVDYVEALDMAIAALREQEERTCETCYGNDMDLDEVDNPCWNCKAGHSEWAPREQEEQKATLIQQYIKVPEKPQWISVEERLPEGGGSVLIYSSFGGVAEGNYSEHYKRWVQYRWSVFEPEVTHWMPLPEPPEVEV